ncbi:zinc-binding dehydrogenase [Rhodococcus wratislaviensis]|uniref:zinc-binding dehydrogenase n=1 Tax=Rhodococcus wratislaviensis TaxID=44752 RepID=UPI0036580BF3
MPKAIWFTEARTAELREEQVGPPQANEVQVTALCSLVSPGSELNLYRGDGNLPDLLLPTAAGTLPFPVKFAYQTVGEITEVPPGSNWTVGERVFCKHPHQDLFNIATDSGMVERIDPDMDPRSAVFTAMFRTALIALLDAPARTGDCVAVAGLGLIGAFCAYLARKNASQLVVIDPLAGRRERASWIGADAVVAPDDAAATIDELTHGRGVDLFIESSGAPSALQLGLQTTGVGGTIDVVSWYGTRKVELLLSPEFHLRRHRLLSSHVSGLDSGAHAGWSSARALEVSLQHLTQLNLSDLITHEIPFDRAPEAYALIDANPADTMGVLLVH